MENKLVCRPGLDVVFKKLFTDNTDLLKDFLSLVFETEIADLTFMNTEVLPEQFDEKLSILDILLKTKNGSKINVELQNSSAGNYKERSIFYCSKLYAMDFNSGKDYSTIAKTVCINILQFNLFKGDNYRSTVYPIIKETGEIISDKWQMIYYETPKLPTEIADRMELWLKFFTVDTEEALLDMEKTNDTAILKASIAVKKMNADEKMRELARVREKAQLTQRLVRYEGYNEAKMEAVQRMLKKSYPIAEIADILELPISTINELANT